VHQGCGYVLIAAVCRVPVFDAVANVKQPPRHYKIYRTRNSTDDQQEKMKYKSSRITDEDMKQFALCQTKATEVCIMCGSFECIKISC